MKKRVDNPKPPFQLFIKNDAGEFVTTKTPVWVCGECGLLSVGAHTFEGASDCCKIKRCECEKELEDYRTMCSDCWSFKSSQKQEEKFNAMEIIEDDGGPVFDPSEEKYYESMSDFLDHCYDYSEDEEDFVWPEYVQACATYKIGTKLDSGTCVNQIVEWLTEDHEDSDSISLVGVDLLKKDIEKFLKKQKFVEWMCRDKRVKVPTKDQL